MIAVAAAGFKSSTAPSGAAEEVTAAARAVAAVERCKHDRRGVRFYRQRFSQHRAVRGESTPWPVGRKPLNCADAHWLAELWPPRAFRARTVTERWVERHVLQSLPFGGAVDPWPIAVREVQVLFPGTEAWSLSCSDAEGWEAGRTEWIGFAGVAYSDRLRDSDTVGGPGQFRFSTFKGMWRHAVEFAIERGFVIPKRLRGESLAAKTRAWRSALGQAMAMGWARFTGNDNSHWSASWSNGCR